MKELTGFLFMLAFTLTASGQYYYKDIIVTRQTNEKWSLYKSGKVRSVKLLSLDPTGQPAAGFDCKQSVSNNFTEIRTTTVSNMTTASSLTAFYDSKGLLKKTIDTSDTYQSTTEYEYDAAGHVLSINNSSLETDNQIKNTENHIWTYDPQGIPTGMLKIRNNTDTTYVKFVTDEKGDIVEEHPVSHRLDLPVIFYYYNNDHFLTDIVRFNKKANRLLPDYIFGPDAQGQIISMLFLPPGTNEYQQWAYEYNEKGLRQTETCYNKKKELMGKIEYEYDFSR